MAGFYGRVSNTNKSAFTFDITYPSRHIMDQQAQSDGVFIGRYVEVEYDDPPITGYKFNNTFYSDANHTKALVPINGYIYQDLHAVNTTGSFYIYESRINSFTAINASTGFAANYNTDVRYYGRAYDSTAWVKTVDPSSGMYRYVLVAEMNTVVPNFHLVADPPSTTPAAPYFDGNSTNLDYYFHVQTPYGSRIATATDALTDQKIVYKEALWDSTNHRYIVVESDPNGTPGDIYYNRAGFRKDVRHFVDQGKYYTTTEASQLTSIDSINYTYGSTGRLYEGSDGNGHTADDVLLWHIYLPSIGNAICEVWDYMFTTARKLQVLDETFNNSSYCTWDTGSILGIGNSMRAYIGRVYANSDTLTDGYTQARAQSAYHTSIMFQDTQDERKYLYPVYTNTWTEGTGANALYYLDNGVYKLANKAALPAGTKYYVKNGGNANAPLITYKHAYSRAKTGLVTGGESATIADRGTHGVLPNTIYGAIAYINRIMGFGLKDADSRDDRTVIGVMNMAKDMIANVDTQLTPSRWVISNASGVMTTSAVPYTAPISGGVLDSAGNWVPRWYQILLAAQSSGVGEMSTNTTTVSAENSKLALTLATHNKWIRLMANNSTKQVTFAHALCGIAAATIEGSMTGWSTSGNELKIPTITFDEAGHITGHSLKSFYLENFFKTFAIAAQSSAVTNSTGNTTSVVADSVADTFTFATANKWLTISGANNTVTFGHITSGVTAGSYGLAANETIATLDVDNVFEVPYFTVDQAGHITAASTKTVTIPENFTKITVDNADTGTNNLNTATGTVEANTLIDELHLQTANNWLRLAVSDHTIKIGHKTITPTETTPTVDFNSNTTTFTADEVSWDGAGHISSRAKTTYTLPYGWKVVSVVNNLTAVTGLTAANASATATTPIDTLTITSNNKWLLLAANNKSITIAHALTGNGVISNKGTGSAVTTQYGMKFKVPYISIDEAGHVTSLSDIELTMPSISLSNGTGNVVTSLSLNTTNGAFTETRADIGTLLITGYAIAQAGSALAATDSLNAALGKLEKRLKTIEDDYLTASALTPYATAQTIADTYLTQSDASSTYLTQNDASSTYLTQNDASSTYLTQSDASTTYLTQSDAATIYQPVEDPTDPYTVQSYVDDAVADAIAEIGRNYQLTLIPITFTAAYDNSTIEVEVEDFDGQGTVWLQVYDNEESDWITVSESAQAAGDDPITYTIEENGTYRIGVKRQYNGSEIISYSESIIVNDIVPSEPEEPDPNEPSDEPEGE